MTQRDKMRALYKRYTGNRERACDEYARAEKEREVKRESNTNRMSAEDYASRLWSDGIRRGWLSR
jgi:hypothetical protein